MRFITRRVRLAVCTTETLLQVAFAGLDLGAAECVHRVGKVDRDARRDW